MFYNRLRLTVRLTETISIVCQMGSPCYKRRQIDRSIGGKYWWQIHLNCVPIDWIVCQSICAKQGELRWHKRLAHKLQFWHKRWHKSWHTSTLLPRSTREIALLLRRRIRNHIHSNILQLLLIREKDNLHLTILRFVMVGL